MGMMVSYDVLVIVVPDKTDEVLQIIGGLPSVDDYLATLITYYPGVIAELKSKPSWLTLMEVDSCSAVWEAEGLPQELVVKLTYSLLKGASILRLKEVSEAGINWLQQALDELLYYSEPDYLYDISTYFVRGTYVLAIARIGNTQGRVSGHSTVVISASYSPDSLTILTLSEDGTVRVWEALTGQELFSLPFYENFFKKAQYSPDGNKIVTTGADGLVKLWDAKTGEEVLAINSEGGIGIFIGETIVGQNSIATLRWSDGYDNVVSIWDLRTGEKRIQTAGNTVVYSPDGRYLVTASDDGPTLVWDESTGEPLFTLAGHSPIYSPDGYNLLTLTENNSATVWDARTGKPRFSLNDPFPSFSGRSDIWSQYSWTDLEYILNGAYILTRSYNQETKIWDARTGQQILQISGYGKVIFSPDGASRATFSNQRNNNQLIQFWDSRTGQELMSVTGKDAQYSPDGSCVIVEVESRAAWENPSVINGLMEVWEVHSRKRLFTLIGNQAIYCPDKHYILTILDDDRVLVWEALTGQLRATLGQIRTLVREGEPPDCGGAELRETIEEIPMVERFAEVLYPEKVRPEQHFAIKVGLLHHSPEEVPDAQSMNVLVTVDAEGRSTGAKPVKVTLYSTAFDLLSANGAELQVYANKDTEAFPFVLKPKPGIGGLQAVHLTFYQGWECLGQIGAVINVVPSLVQFGQAGWLNKRMTLRSPFEREWGLTIPPPDVVLYINRQTYQGRDTLFYEYEWVKEGWSRVEAGNKPLLVPVEEWIEARYSALNKFAGTNVSAHLLNIDSDKRELEKIGEGLYSDLFTPQLKNFYRRFAPTTQSLLIYSNEPWIPWEVVKPWSDDLEDELSDFLCTRFQFSRWYINEEGQRIRSAMELRQLSAIIPPLSDLPSIRKEAECLRALPQKWPSLVVQQLVPRNVYEVLDRMIEGTFNLFHFATHGSRRTKRSSVAAISLGRDSLHISDIMGKDILKGLKRSAPLIFINACHSGRQEQGLNQLESWADRFVQFGCSGFVGANWEIHDGLASEFAIKFYENLQSDKTVAQAVRDARLALRAENPTNSTWLAYSLYAHPNLKVRMTD